MRIYDIDDVSQAGMCVAEITDELNNSLGTLGDADRTNVKNLVPVAFIRGDEDFAESLNSISGYEVAKAYIRGLKERLNNNDEIRSIARRYDDLSAGDVKECVRRAYLNIASAEIQGHMGLVIACEHEIDKNTIYLNRLENGMRFFLAAAIITISSAAIYGSESYKDSSEVSLYGKSSALGFFFALIPVCICHAAVCEDIEDLEAYKASIIEAIPAMLVVGQRGETPDATPLVSPRDFDVEAGQRNSLSGWVGYICNRARVSEANREQIYPHVEL